MTPPQLMRYDASMTDEAQTALVTTEAFPSFPKGSLRGFERIAEPLVRFVNLTRWCKALVEFFVLPFSGTWIRWVARPRLTVSGMEPLLTLDPPRGLILVSNHRSFFDMYLATSVLRGATSLIHNQTFPVRSTFFYEGPLGLLVNMAISGCSMWPPVFRDDRKMELNPISMAQTCFVTSKKGAIMGYHPEGTRGKGPDPYEFLPARPGIGEIVQQCHADTLVLPFFILGPSDNLLNDLKLRRNPAAHPIQISFGELVRCEDLRRDQDALEISQSLMAGIHEMAVAYRDKQEPGSR
jgi:1-acyl-sn-glycerol-3-phosphate acyltransferase